MISENKKIRIKRWMAAAAGLALSFVAGWFANGYWDDPFPDAPVIEKYLSCFPEKGTVRTGSLPPVIAHAGGTPGPGLYYSNCREAVELSLKAGYTLIELDLIMTSDGHLVAGHDWKYVNNITGSPQRLGMPVTKKEFTSRKIYGKYTPLTAEDILRIMEEHPEMILVTDKMCSPKILLEYFGSVKKRLYVEAKPDSFLECANAGFGKTMLSVKDMSRFASLEKHLKKIEKAGVKIDTVVCSIDGMHTAQYKFLREKTGLEFFVYFTKDPAFIREKIIAGRNADCVYSRVPDPSRERLTAR